MSERFYVYGLKHPITKRVLYCGVTRRLEARLDRHFDLRLACALGLKNLPVPVILETGVGSPSKALRAESKWIKRLAKAGEPLINATHAKPRREIICIGLSTILRVLLREVARKKGQTLQHFIESVLLQHCGFRPAKSPGFSVKEYLRRNKLPRKGSEGKAKVLSSRMSRDP